MMEIVLQFLARRADAYNSARLFNIKKRWLEPCGEETAVTLIEKYKTYRKIGMRLNNKMIEKCLSRDVIKNSAELLGIARGDTLLFDTEDVTSVLMDFAFNDYRADDKNIVEIYQEKIGGKNEIEKEILDALLSSYTSLFKVVSISEEESTLVLNDVLNKEDGIKLMDISLSKTAFPGLLLFTRLLSFKDFNMTSGVSLAFPGEIEGYLLREYERLSKKVGGDSDSIKRFVSFFMLNKICGIEIGYARV